MIPLGGIAKMSGLRLKLRALGLIIAGLATLCAQPILGFSEGHQPTIVTTAPPAWCGGMDPPQKIPVKIL